MPRPFKGQLIERRGTFSLRLALSKDLRPCVALATCTTRAQAEERQALLIDLATTLRAAGRLQEAPELLEMAAVRSGRALEAVLAAAEVIIDGDAERKPDPSVSFQEFAEQWTSGELHRLYPDHVRSKKTVDDDISRFVNHIYPHIGRVPLKVFSLQDAQLVMASLPEGMAANTRRNIALLLNHVLELAVFPACIIERNPLPRAFAPKAPKAKAHSYLYPEEEAKLMACKRVPLLDRLAFGILAREGLRASELREVAWREIDLERGTIMLDVNKTDDPRSWVLDPSVVRALRIWRALYHSKAESHDYVLVDSNGTRLVLDKMAKRLRAHLVMAGVKRDALFHRSDQRMHMRAHDLRASFVTLALASGKTETWVADRTGHRSSAMINRYRQAARSAAELRLGWLRPLDRTIPELRKGTERARRLTIAK